MREPASDLTLWHQVQRIVYPGSWPSHYPPYARSEASVTRKRASWLYYTLLDDSELRAKVIRLPAYCTCAYYQEDGTPVEGKPCSIHPNGCEHGNQWNEPCIQCRDVIWGKGAPARPQHSLEKQNG